jgi:hypothetical protein
MVIANWKKLESPKIFTEAALTTQFELPPMDTQIDDSVLAAQNVLPDSIHGQQQSRLKAQDTGVDLLESSGNKDQFLKFRQMTSQESRKITPSSSNTQANYAPTKRPRSERYNEDGDVDDRSFPQHSKKRPKSSFNMYSRNVAPSPTPVDLNPPNML